MPILNVKTYAGPFPQVGAYDGAISLDTDSLTPDYTLISEAELRAIITSQDTLSSPDGGTFMSLVDGEIQFTVDNNLVGSMGYDTGLSMGKLTWPGIIDPAAMQLSPQTLAQRDAFVASTPLLRTGYMVYVVDTGVDEVQLWDGAAWNPVGTPDTGRWTLLNAVGPLQTRERYILLADGTYALPTTVVPGDAISVVNSSGSVSVSSAGGVFFGAAGQLVPNPGDSLALPPYTVIQLFSVGTNNWSVVTPSDSRVELPNLTADGQLGTVANLLGSVWVVNQTTAGITATLPAQQSLSTQILTVVNSGTESITIEGAVVPAGQMRRFVAIGATWEPEVVAAAQTDWIVATNNIQTVDDGSYVVGSGLTVLMPVAPLSGQSVRFAPQSDWSSLNVTFSAAGATTVADGQTLPSGTDIAEAVYDQLADNWVFFLGGSPTPHTSYEVIADLPSPGSVDVGTVVSVVNDPDPDYNGEYTAVGAAVGSPAVAWSK